MERKKHETPARRKSSQADATQSGREGGHWPGNLVTHRHRSALHRIHRVFPPCPVRSDTFSSTPARPKLPPPLTKCEGERERERELDRRETEVKKMLVFDSWTKGATKEEGESERPSSLLPPRR